MVEENDIRKRITKDAESIVISRVPGKTARAFKAFANEEFTGDYGMALKHLLDYYVGLVPNGWEHLEDALEGINTRVTALERVKDEPKKRRMMDGEEK